LTPDTLNTNITNAGLGVFIVNAISEPPQTLYFKAALDATTSVLMAEVAALALAAIITNKLGLQQVTFLSDNQQLANFLNEQDQSNPLDWRMKYCTQIFGNSITQRHSTIHRIHRTQNQTADDLARQVLAQS
jgi:ribonuclease HI